MRQPLCSGCYTSSCCASPPLQRSLPGVSFSLPRSFSDGCSQVFFGISRAAKSSALVLECPCWSLQISILPWNSSLACSPALVFACAALRSSSEPLSSLALRPSYHFSFAHHRHAPHSCAWSPSLLLSSLLISPTVLPTLGWILGVARVCVSSFPPPSHPQCLALLPASAARPSSACPPTSR